LKEAINVLLEGTPKDVDIHALRTSLEKTPGVKNIHDLHVWSLTSSVNAMSAHVVKETGYSQNQLLKTLTDATVNNFTISHTTFQIEEEGYEENEVHL
jgi:cobalt-zinc-cadmium efflux system protein